MKLWLLLPANMAASGGDMLLQLNKLTKADLINQSMGLDTNGSKQELINGAGQSRQR